MIVIIIIVIAISIITNESSQVYIDSFYNVILYNLISSLLLSFSQVLSENL